MNDNINLPPFYPGQKIVAVKSMDFVEKDRVYTCHSCTFIACCNRWEVHLVEFAVPTTTKKPAIFCCDCGTITPAPGASKMCGPDYLFAPLEEKFESITLEKVLENETKLVSAN